jgi:hypothetical protein
MEMYQNAAREDAMARKTKKRLLTGSSGTSSGKKDTCNRVQAPETKINNMGVGIAGPMLNSARC